MGGRGTGARLPSRTIRPRGRPRDGPTMSRTARTRIQQMTLLAISTRTVPGMRGMR